MADFEKLLAQARKSVELFVKYKISSAEEAQDILQETYLTAWQKFGQLKNEDAFKPWIISIARNKCNDYFRNKAAVLEIPLEEAPELTMDDGRMGISEVMAVRDHLEKMADKEKEILYLYFWKQLPQAEIAKRLNVPVGTVKSRLHVAKEKFRESYDAGMGHLDKKMEGKGTMKRLPEIMPKYTIAKTDKEPFAVKWEELMGWFLVPKLGEKISWGMYDQPSGRLDHVYDMEVTGRAMVHGIEGVELTAREASYSDKKDVIQRTFVAQLTDTHCRYLATIRNDNGVRNYITFLDGEEFMQCWGYGEDNVGNETDLRPKGIIQRDGNVVTTPGKDFVLDVVGRYDVTIAGKTYDTVCVLDISTYNNGVVSEQFLDRNGRTILWRRFNKNDWHIERYGGKLWSEQLPENDRLIVDGETYVQWYDCITDYVVNT
ncbi:MAG: sigma-70 family RNA polymerase sigma factor [Lachnospiraceae bacterium]|nr:sigma-70 family RNA polymerase sigma factor [Lachnospiraceae bacterium]